MLKRRDFLKGAAILGGAALFGKSVFALSKKVRIGVLAPSHCAMPVVYGQTLSLYKKAGIESTVVYAKDMKEIVKGLQTGDLDFGQIMAPLAIGITAGVQQFPKMPLAATQILGINGGVLAISAKHDIKKLTDLKGKTIGVHSPFIVHSLILDYILEKSGLDAKKDLTIKVIPMNEMAKALEEGAIDGFINSEPMPTSLEKKGLAKTLLKTKMFWLDHPCCVLTTRSTTLEKEKNLVADVTRATMVAGLILNREATRGKAISDIQKSAAPYQNIPLLVLLEACGTERSDFYPFPYKSSGVVIADRMKKGKLLDQQTDTDMLAASVFKSEFAMEIMKEAVKEVPGSKVPETISRHENISLT